MNPYAYVGGNPETNSDPTGQMMCSATCHGGGGSSGDNNNNNQVSGSNNGNNQSYLDNWKGAWGISKLIVAYSVKLPGDRLRGNQAGMISDLIAGFDTYFPGFDDSNTIRLFSNFALTNGTSSRISPIVESLPDGAVSLLEQITSGAAHVLNFLALGYAVTDLYQNVTAPPDQRNGWSIAADALLIASIMLQYLNRKGNSTIAEISISLGVISATIQVGNFLIQVGTWATNQFGGSGNGGGGKGGNSRQRRSYGGGGGGLGGFPPISPILPPMPNVPGSNVPGENGGYPYPVGDLGFM